MTRLTLGTATVATQSVCSNLLCACSDQERVGSKVKLALCTGTWRNFELDLEKFKA